MALLTAGALSLGSVDEMGPMFAIALVNFVRRCRATQRRFPLMADS